MNGAGRNGPEGKVFDFQYGERHIKVSLPESRIVQDIAGNQTSAVRDVPAAVKAALRNPIGTPPLKEIVKAGDKVAILVSDITRVWVRSDCFLPTLLDELNEVGVPDKDVFIVITLGGHRFHTAEENILVCGKDICHRVAIYQHDCHDEDNLVHAGTTSRGLEVRLNKKVAEADRVILTGGVAYHLMAGFSGGRKSVLPGIAGYGTIQANHRFNLHEEEGKGVNPHCAGGILDGNEMNEDMIEAAAFLNPAFLLNAVYTPDGNFAGFFAGHWLEAWKEACSLVKEIYGIPITEQADVVIASAGGYPRDINFYQGMKPLQNAGRAAKPGGVVILFMECRDIQEPPSFSRYIQTDATELETALRKDFTVPGFVALKGLNVAKTVTVILITKAENGDFVRKAGMIPVTNVEEALAIAAEKLGHDDYTITVMTHAGSTVPVVNTQT